MSVTGRGDECYNHDLKQQLKLLPSIQSAVSILDADFLTQQVTIYIIIVLLAPRTQIRLEEYFISVVR